MHLSHIEGIMVTLLYSHGVWFGMQIGLAEDGRPSYPRTGAHTWLALNVRSC